MTIKISGLLIGMVVISMVCLGFAEMWLESATTYGADWMTVSNMTMTKTAIGNMNSSLRQMSTQFKNDQANANAYFPLLAPVTGALYLWNSMIIIPSFISDALSFGDYGAANFIPWWFITGLLTIIGLIVLFGIMAYLQGNQP